jgi:hypothetical protein
MLAHRFTPGAGIFMVERARARTGVVAVVNGAAFLAGEAAVFSLILGDYVAWVVWALLGTAPLVAAACLWTGHHPLHSRRNRAWES